MLVVFSVDSWGSILERSRLYVKSTWFALDFAYREVLWPVPNLEVLTESKYDVR